MYKKLTYLILLTSALLLLTSCAPPAEQVAPSPGTDQYEIEVYSQNSELQIDGISSTDITVKVKKNKQYMENLPSGWNLYAHHIYGGSTLIIPDQQNNEYNGEFNGTLSIIKVSPLAVGVNVPVNIECQVDPNKVESNFVLLLSVKDENGEEIDFEDEYMRVGSTSYNLSWNSWGMHDPGAYSMQILMGYYDDKDEFVQKYASQTVSVYIKGDIGGIDVAIPYVGSKSILNLTSPANANHRDKDSIYVTLKNNVGLEKASNFSDPLEIVFLIPSLYRAQAKAIPAFNLTSKVGGIPAVLSFPGTGTGSSKIIEVTIYKGDPKKQIAYQLNMDNKNIKIISILGSQKEYYYGTDEYKDVAYIVADIVNEITQQSCEEIGLKIDNSYNVQLDKETGGYDIDIWTDNNVVTYKMKGAGGGEYYFEYDPNTLTLKSPDGLNIESLYSIDVNQLDVWLASLPQGSNAVLPSVGIAAADVKAQYISWNDIQKLIGLAIIAPTWLHHTANLVVGTILVSQSWPEELYPHDYPGPVEITYGYLDAQGSSLKYIQGTAAAFKTIELYREGGYIDQTTTDSNGYWQIDNNMGELDLMPGINKFKAKATDYEGCEAESGEITVNNEEPYFALLYPGDGEVIWGHSPDLDGRLKCAVRLSVFAPEGTKIHVKSSQGLEKGPFLTDSNWEFKNDYNLIDADFEEGENTLEFLIIKDGKEKVITKKIIVAFDFENKVISKKYVLRKGDMLFCTKDDNDLDALPKEPDHVGIYIAKGKVSESWRGRGVWSHPIYFDGISEVNKDFLNHRFYYSAQPRKIVNEDVRNKVVQRTKEQEGKPYDMPFLAPLLNRKDGQKITLNILGHYDGETNGFYCSEQAYYVWDWAAKQSNKNMKIDFGIDKNEVLWPWNDENVCAMLPAKLGSELMECRRLQ